MRRRAGKDAHACLRNYLKVLNMFGKTISNNYMNRYILSRLRETNEGILKIFQTHFDKNYYVSNDFS